MAEGLFHLRHGIIPACDVRGLDEFRRIVEATSDLTGVVGYKVGSTLALRHGLPPLVRIVTEYCELPVIYDHQKAGTDIPELGPEFAETCASAGVRGAIVFPQAGPKTGTTFIRSLIEQGVCPIIGGEMTHPSYLARDGGFLLDTAPEQIYRLGASEGARHFVVPGNKIEAIQRYSAMLAKVIEGPIFLMPGIGRQGGDVGAAFTAAKRFQAYAIIGSSIHRADDLRRATQGFCEIALHIDRSWFNEERDK